jgi:hypothetical protein
MSGSYLWRRGQLCLFLVLMAFAVLPAQGQTTSDAETWHADPAVVARLARERRNRMHDERLVPEYTLPPLFEQPPANLDEWEARRVEILQILQQHWFGRMPAPPERIEVKTVSSEPLKSIAGGVRKRIELTCHLQNGKVFKFGYWLYAVEGERRPVFVMINNREPELANPKDEKFGEFVPVPVILEAGFALAVFQHNDLAPDDPKTFRNGLLKHVIPASERAPDAPGAIAAWAWGASTLLTSLADQPLVDDTRAVVIGHSRGGKTALLVGAVDPRFKLAISNESGCGGAALARRMFGETVEQITTRFGYWFCPRAAEYANREAEMPFDQHFLAAAICPRHVAIGSASDDLGADPRGEWLGLVNASPAFEAVGIESLSTEDTMPPLDQPAYRGATSYHVRRGDHNLLVADWNNYILAAKRAWQSPGAVQ